MADEIILRGEAKAKGLTRYFTGKPCSKGHVAARGTKNGCCVVCAYEAETRYREANRDKFREKWRTYEQNASAERKDKHREHVKKWADANPEKNRERIERWEAANPDRKAAHSKKWSDANPAKIAAKNKRYKAENVERLAPIARERTKQWIKDNPLQAKHQRRVYRARKLGAPGSHTAEEAQALLEKQGWRCPYCAADLHDGKHLDHIVAIVNGGSNDIENMQWTCQPCNNKKHSKDPIAFAQEMGLLTSKGERMSDYPKWVTPHESFIGRGDGIPVNVPLWPDFHVDRGGAVTVIVQDADEEARAMSPLPINDNASAEADQQPADPVPPSDTVQGAA